MSLLKTSRLEALTDGVFAIAMTILVLDIRVPSNTIASNLPSVFNIILFKLFIYAGSFIILGTLWIAMNFQIGILYRINRPYIWCNILYLLVICVVPFSASLMAAFPNSSISVRFFAINLLCAMLVQLLVCECARFFRLNGERYNHAIYQAIVKRIVLAPFFLYNCFVNREVISTHCFLTFSSTYTNVYFSR